MQVVYLDIPTLFPRFPTGFGVAMDASAVKAYGQLIYVNVRLMWPVPLSPPKALFFATRYYTLVHSVFSSLWWLTLWVVTWGAEALWRSIAILFFRIWAFSERNKKLSVYLLFHFITVNSAALAIMIKLLLAQGSIMVVMVGVGLWKYRNFHSLASTNIALTFLGPPALRFLLLEPQILAHAMLSTRLLLHLRKWAERDHVRGSARCLVPSTVGMPSAIVFGCPDAGTGGNGGRGIGGGNGCGELC
ncbi:hypothetical protein D9611_014774 [Ephemerocybe angulata]|uniref:Uncharacterized protein n=1 Tax=Ephemerocybe angulata TaxID=980116 RepID=A0A8H5C9V0_9AGAR|nr:hypothetical protein D9611_014774 [Tulosesus angulatus]